MDFASRRNRILLAAALIVSVAGGAGCARRRPRSAGRGAAKAELAAIDGRVLTAAGSPLGDATLVLDWDDDPEARGADRVPLASVRGSADGRFHIANVPPGRYWLRAHAAEHADGRVRLEAHPGETLTTSVRLAQAETLTGQVVDRGGQPIPGSRVLVWSLADPAERPREARTDDAGRFVLGGLAHGLHRLIAEAPGFGSVEQGPIEVPSAAPVLRMATDGHEIAGTVTSGGAPVAGARVVIGGENLAPSRETTSNGNGGFLFGGLGAGAYVLRAARGGEVSRVSSEVIVDRSGERPPVVRLDLGPGWMISGRVLDDSGRALSAAEVRVDALPGEDPLPELVRPDARGNWRAGPLPAGEYRLTPRQPGFVARRPVQLLIGSSTVGGDRPQILELVRGAEIVGRVVDGRGVALPGAAVRCLVPGREDLSVIADRLPLAAEAAGLPSGSGHALGRTRTTATDSGGRFHLADMLPGRVFVEVSRGGSVPHRSGELGLLPGQRLDLGAVTLRDGVRIIGRVVDQADAPIEGARVVVAATPASGREAEIVLVTDRGGQFATAVLEGAHEFRVSAAGTQSQRLTVDVAAASPPNVVVHLARADGVLDGSVRDEQGRPLARARVIAWPAPAPGTASHAPVPSDGATPLASAVTDPGGHFQLTRLPRGHVAVEVKHGDYPPVTELADVTASPRAPLVIKVPVPGGVEGEVRETVTGAVVSTYRIEARGPEGRVAAATRKNGTGFALSRLVPGRWTLSVRAPGYAVAERVIDVPIASALGEPSVRDLRVELAPESRN